jgi:hypothetical protein
MKFKMLETVIKTLSTLQTGYQMISGTKCKEPTVYNQTNRRLPAIQIYLSGSGIWDSVQNNNLSAYNKTAYK